MTPSKSAMAKLAESGDRFELMKVVTSRVPAGTRRICDVKGVGPANPSTFKMSVDEWDDRMAAESNGQCKGAFCAGFSKKQLTRQCELTVSGTVCDLCALLCGNGNAEEKGSKFVTLQGVDDYIIIKQAIFKRSGVQECL